MSGGFQLKATCGQGAFVINNNFPKVFNFWKVALIFSHFFREQQAVALAHLDEVNAIIDS